MRSVLEKWNRKGAHIQPVEIRSLGVNQNNFKARIVNFDRASAWQREWILMVIIALSISLKPVHAQSTLQDGLVGYWNFDETQGTAASNAHGDLDGALSGDVTINQEGKIGRSYLFGQTSKGDDHVSLEDIGNWSRQTWACWVKVHSIERGYIMFGGSSNWNIQKFEFRNGRFLMSFYDEGASHPIVTSDDSLALNTWYHVATSFGADGLKLYVNGVLQQDQHPYTGTGQNPRTNKTIGSGTIQAHSVDGLIDEVGIWNRTLSEDEIDSLYNGGSGNTYPFDETGETPIQNQGLVAYYPFTGNAANSSGNGNDGTINGATLTQDRFGNAESAYFFDGSSGIRVDSHSELQIEGDVSLSAWINVPNIPTNEWNILSQLGDGENLNTNALYFVDLDRGGSLRYGHEYSNGINETYHTTESFINSNKWHNIILVRDIDSSIYRIFVDGKEVVSQSFNNNPEKALTDNIQELFIGSRNSISTNFIGNIDDIKIYSEALTAQAVQVLYANYYAPDTLIAEAGYEHVDLKWSSERISSLQSYHIYRDGNLIDSVIVSSDRDTSYTDAGLISGQQYEYFITSRDTLGNVSQHSETILATPMNELLAHYPFNGNANDESGNGNDGTVHGAVLINDRFSNSNSAYSFDGIGDYIDINYPQLNSQSFSKSLWFKLKNDALKVYQSLFGGRSGTTTRIFSIQLQYDDSAQLIVTFDGGAVPVRPDLNYNVNLFDNVWHHLFISSDSSNVDYYLDGALIYSVEQSARGNLSEYQVIGAYDDNGSIISHSEAFIDDLKIYNEGLSAQTVQALYANYHAPDTLIAEVGYEHVDLKWSSERISSLQSYHIYRDGNLIDSVIVSSDTDTSYTDAGLISSQQYEYFITSRDTLGNVSQHGESIFATPTNGLLAYYSFTGNTEDSSGNGLNGSLVGDGVNLRDDRFGQSNSAFQFDGSGDHISIGDFFDFDADTSFSFVFWLNPDENSSDMAAFGKRQAGGELLGYEFWAYSNSSPMLFTMDFGTDNSMVINSTQSVTSSEWQQIAIVRNGHSGKIYLNGVDVTGSITDSRNSPLPSISEDFKIGRGRNTSNGFDGGIDDFRIFDYALDSNEIDSLYQLKGWPLDSSTESDSLIAYYPFTGNAVDSSGNGNNGTVNGATLTEDRFGNQNSAYEFNSANSTHIDIPDDALNEEKGTVALWFKLADSFRTSGEGGQVFSSSQFGSPDGTRLYISIDPANDSLGGSFISTSFRSEEIQRDQWYHVAFTWNADSAIYYVNGNKKNHLQGGQPVAGRVSLGSYGEGHNGFFDGAIDDVRIYNCSLAHSEIQNLVDYSASDTTIYKLDLETVSSLQEGDKTTLFSTISNISDTYPLKTLSFHLSYDTTAFEYIPDSAVAGEFWGNIPQFSTSKSQDSSFVNVSVETSDENGVSGSGIISQLGFEAKQAGTYSFIINEIEAKDEDGNDLMIVGDTVEVTVSAQDTNNPRLTDGLVAYYPFNGNANDESGNGHDGNVNGASLTADRNGDSDAAYGFDGVDDWIEISDASDIELDTAYTISLWYYSNETQDSYARLIARENPRSGNRQFVIKTSENGNSIESVNDFTDGSTFVTSVINYESSTWNSVVINYRENERVTVYSNGVLTQTHNISKKIISLDKLISIGRSGHSNSLFWKGTLDDIRIYNRALSSDEVTTLYELEKPQEEEIPFHEQGLVAYYPFNGNANDESGNGHDGTVNGALLTSDRNGNSNSAYNFDGDDDYINFGDIDNILTETNEPWSCSGWINWDGSAKRAVIWTNWTSSINQRKFRFWYDHNNSTWGATFYDNTGTPAVSFEPGASFISANQWTHITMTYDGSNASVYKNGTLVHSETITSTQSGGEFVLGHVPSLERYYSGLLDDIRLYNRALSSEEVSTLYEMEKSAEATPVNISFIANTSTLPDTLQEYHEVQIRGAVVGPNEANINYGISWDSGTSAVAENIGGDYWQFNFAMSPGDTLNYKLFAGYDSENGAYNGTVNGWETNENRQFILPSDFRGDTTMTLWYETRTNPFEDKEDSVGIKFRVNMGAQAKLGDFNSNADLIGVRGSINDWADNFLVLEEENPPGDGDNLFYSGILYVPDTLFQASVNSEFLYKYVYESGDQVFWEEGPDNFGRLPATDTTFHWKFFSGQRPIEAEIIEHNLSFEVDLAVLTGLGFFSPGYDSVYVRGSMNGWGKAEEYLMSPVGVGSKYELTATLNEAVGATANYKYYVQYPAERFEEGSDTYFEGADILEPNEQEDLGFEESGLTGGGVRQYVYDNNVDPKLVGVHFFNGVPFAGLIADFNVDGGATEVTFRVDMSNATNSAENSASLFNPASDSVWIFFETKYFAFTQGVAPGTIGSSADEAEKFRMTDSDGDMVYELTLPLNLPTINHIGFTIGYGSEFTETGELVRNGGGFEAGRRYYQYIQPTEVFEIEDDGEIFFAGLYSSSYTLPVLEWVAENLPYEEMPDYVGLRTGSGSSPSYTSIYSRVTSDHKITLTGKNFGASFSSNDAIELNPLPGQSSLSIIDNVRLNTWNDTTIVFQVPEEADPGNYELRITADGINASNTDTLVILPSIEVWPGDTNNDQIVTASDLIPISLYYGDSDPDTLNGLTWRAWQRPVWEADSSNHQRVFADANGDGTIDVFDLQGLHLNYENKQGDVSEKTTSELLAISDTLHFELSFTKQSGQNVLMLNRTDKHEIPVGGLGMKLYDASGQLSSAEASLSQETRSLYPLSFVQNLSEQREIHIALAGNQSDSGDNPIKHIDVHYSEQVSLTDSELEILDLRVWSIAGHTIPVTFRESDDEATNLEEEIEQPQEVTLRQNYPNPFNPTTIISYGLPESSEISLEIYTLTGQLIYKRTEHKSAGWHQIGINAQHWSSGVYFYRLRTETEVITKKMVLIK